MQVEELEDIVECIDCGAPMAPGQDRAFALSDDAFLCLACATRRGGVYDETEDRWAAAPNVGDEPDERRRHV